MTDLILRGAAKLYSVQMSIADFRNDLHLPAVVIVFLIAIASAQNQPAQSAPASPRPAQRLAQTEESPKDQAWDLLNSGASNANPDTRRAAIGALGLLLHQRRAAELAENALVDEKQEVRSAAATALGQMDSDSSIPQLEQTLHDKEPAVVLAAARSLVHFKQESGYDVYYEVLTGKRKAGKGVVASQLDTLKNPKKLAEMGFEEGIGFVPFGGMGLEAFKTIHGSSSASVRAAAAKVLTKDSDLAVGDALKDAVGDDSWQVRVAAVDAIAERGDPKLVAAVVPAMSDEKDAVKFTAAAAVLRLTQVESPVRPKRRRQRRQ